MDPRMQEILDKMATAAYTVGESAVKGAKFAGKKAGELWDAGKVRVKLIELRNKETALYEQLGRKVYAISRGEAENREELDALLAQITAVAEERSSYSGSGVNLCPACGAEVGENARFCSRCGAVIDRQEEKAEETKSEENAGGGDD